ncbi:metallophosphoesterase [Variovorax robiniae]|uniref:Metallophosphoesterase n=1 Tax=Variovorax robiniae TaxID=1836199 RepID=A0ABU8XGW9_9BURK
MTAIARFVRNTLGRDFAVGDIHGAFGALQAALAAIGFDSSTDRLFSVGDLVDRGPESAQVLAWLDLPWFHAICGNHDFMAWRSALGLPFKAVDHAAHGGEWLYDLPLGEQRRIGERLRALPMAFEVETAGGWVGMVHADFPSDDWRDLAIIDWRTLDNMDSFASQCLWSIERHRRRYRGVVRNIRAVVHGHMTIPAMETLGNVHFIDTGGWHPSGRFTFLELGELKAFTGPGPLRERANVRRNR